MPDAQQENQEPLHITPVQTPDRTKVWADTDAEEHSILLPVALKGRSKAFTYDQVEDVLSNKPGPILSYYLTVEQGEGMFSVAEFLPDIEEARSELVEQFSLVKEWYDAKELLISGVNHGDLQKVLQRLQEIGISRKSLDDSLKADDVFTRYIGEGEDPHIYTIKLANPERNEEAKRCAPEHVISLVLEDLIEKIRLFDVAGGDCQKFATQIFQPSMAIMFLLRASIPPKHHSLIGVATDGSTNIESALAEEIRQANLNSSH